MSLSYIKVINVQRSSVQQWIMTAMIKNNLYTELLNQDSLVHTEHFFFISFFWKLYFIKHQSYLPIYIYLFSQKNNALTHFTPVWWLVIQITRPSCIQHINTQRPIICTPRLARILTPPAAHGDHHFHFQLIAVACAQCFAIKHIHTFICCLCACVCVCVCAYGGKSRIMMPAVRSFQVTIKLVMHFGKASVANS